MPMLIAEAFTVDAEFVKWIATLGVGGVLAAFMFHFYRKDVKEYTDLWRGQSEILISVVKENTASNTKLVTVIEALHARLDGEIDRRLGPDRRIVDMPPRASP